MNRYTVRLWYLPFNQDGCLESEILFDKEQAVTLAESWKNKYSSQYCVEVVVEPVYSEKCTGSEEHSYLKKALTICKDV